MEMKRCPFCGRINAPRFALLPRNGGVACETCFMEKVGHAPLPAGKLSALAYYYGQYLEHGAAWQASSRGPWGATIQGVTAGGVTIQGVTAGGATISGVTITRGR